MPDTDTLVQRYLEGTLTSGEAEELHALLQAHPELGERLLQHFEMDAMLRATKPLVVESMSTRPALLPRRRFTFATVTSVAAMAACIALLGAWLIHQTLSPQPENEEETTASVAVLTRGVNLEWESAAIAPGTPLSPGWLKLKSGIAQIEFYQGARVLIEGPAELQLVSSGEATCTRGKLSAQVPPQAKGFRINTPKGTIVDLGTEFGLDVGAQTAEVHVFKGEVELHRPSATMKSLKEGQAMAIAGATAVLPANASGFASLNEIDARSAMSQRFQFEKWLASSSKLNADASLRLRFDFQEDEGSRSLRNHAANGAQIADGSIVGASWTTGRWPGKRALEFRNVSDRVRLNIPGETKALTLAVWVRVNGLDRTFNSLFMSEGWGDRKTHWQIMRDGRVRLGIAGGGGAAHVDHDTPVLFTPERFGRWTHLAVVYDPATKEVRHYVNGELLTRSGLKDTTPLKIGIAELGNWNDRRSSGGVAIRLLSGAMDEFAFWDRALSDEEIAGLAR
ncbi:LamG-like jellyroll fold domain-containing protein [Prosthecobacter fluviatilis]|uniref:LamG-like jellyroll fold domain-containing protein n=1 Tax=Prosthecobacter fluviatilis TaxID=445931 RepID=A0ABW0KX69_9BACT